jgi:hypothetical protein
VTLVDAAPVREIVSESAAELGERGSLRLLEHV